MDVDPRTGMTILDADSCWALLASADVVRLAVVAAGDLEIFPVNAVVDGHTLVFATGEGTKLAAVTIARDVVLEADGADAERGVAWSVVVRGRAERLVRFADIYRAEELPLRSWTTHPKQWFVRVHPAQVTGRRFVSAAGRGRGRR
ncbi:pyridoxamine 5'-phosphate oxidase family protein [Jiangella alba]|uniref:Pyridoxamine 5'-phosphate oxidase n=1 Tax=Jiangella alba TaxID=561176 RepID=A0A1H5L3A2_9ACTN|nr:pyridoxamine 5'-phosphate oxidase family protein [Jiangella alba]SEE70708.1 Pyridoxamine 5'-phosphate oxidase [Jiangella alba]